MPVLLAPSDWDAWLDRSNDDIESLRSLLVPFDSRALEMFEVSTRVNSIKNNDGELVLPKNSA